MVAPVFVSMFEVMFEIAFQSLDLRVAARSQIYAAVVLLLYP